MRVGPCKTQSPPQPWRCAHMLVARSPRRVLQTEKFNWRLCSLSEINHASSSSMGGVFPLQHDQNRASQNPVRTTERNSYEPSVAISVELCAPSEASNVPQNQATPPLFHVSLPGRQRLSCNDVCRLCFPRVDSKHTRA